MPPIRRPRTAQTKFTTGDDNHVGDDYFLTSGDKIRFFLEEGAIDAQGKLTREKNKAVNKIGHGAYTTPLHLADRGNVFNDWMDYHLQVCTS